MNKIKQNINNDVYIGLIGGNNLVDAGILCELLNVGYCDLFLDNHISNIFNAKEGIDYFKFSSYRCEGKDNLKVNIFHYKVNIQLAINMCIKYNHSNKSTKLIAYFINYENNKRNRNKLSKYHVSDQNDNSSSSNIQTISTLEIAEMMETEHWKILRKLEGRTKNGEHERGYIDILGDNQMDVTDFFIKSSYLTEQNKKMPCYDVTRLGCDFLANKFIGEKGVIFTAKYVKRFHEMKEQCKNNTCNDIYNQELINVINKLTDTIALLQYDLSKIKNNQRQSMVSSSKYTTSRGMSYWTYSMFPKYQALMDYFGLENNGELYKELYIEFTKMYPYINLNKLAKDYCSKNNFDSCYTIEAIENNKEIRQLFEDLVDGLIEKYDLEPDYITTKHKTIFDD